MFPILRTFCFGLMAAFTWMPLANAQLTGGTAAQTDADVSPLGPVILPSNIRPAGLRAEVRSLGMSF